MGGLLYAYSKVLAGESAHTWAQGHRPHLSSPWDLLVGEYYGYGLYWSIFPALVCALICSFMILVEGLRFLVGVVREHELPELPAWYWERSAFLDKLGFKHVVRLLGFCLGLLIAIMSYRCSGWSGLLALGLLGRSAFNLLPKLAHLRRFAWACAELRAQWAFLTGLERFRAVRRLLLCFSLAVSGLTYGAAWFLLVGDLYIIEVSGGPGLSCSQRGFAGWLYGDYAAAEHKRLAEGDYGYRGYGFQTVKVCRPGFGSGQPPWASQV